MSRDQVKMDRVRQAMQRTALDALLLRVPENVVYLSDAWCAQGLSYLIFPLEKEPILIHPMSEDPTPTWVSDVREYSSETQNQLRDPLQVAADSVRQALDNLGISSGTVGVERGWELVAGTNARYETNVVGKNTLSMLRAKVPGIRWENASSLLVKLRAIKTQNEVKMLRKANKIAEVGLRIFEHGLKPGLSEIQLAARIEHEIVTAGVLQHGARKVVACAFVASGPTTAHAYRYAFGSTRRKLRRGDLVMLELDVVVDGYCSDLTRTFVVGKPNKLQKQLIETVLDSQSAAISAIEPNIAGSKVTRISNDVIQRRGFSEYLNHGLGHGIGVAIHEPIPILHLQSKDILQSGMVHSVEPGIYGRKVGGIRIEDDILDTAKGAEYLSTYNRMPE